MFSATNIHIMLIAAAIYAFLRIVEAVLNAWKLNPLTWAEEKAGAFAAEHAPSSSSGLPSTNGSTNMAAA